CCNERCCPPPLSAPHSVAVVGWCPACSSGAGLPVRSVDQEPARQARCRSRPSRRKRERWNSRHHSPDRVKSRSSHGSPQSVCECDFYDCPVLIDKWVKKKNIREA